MKRTIISSRPWKDTRDANTKASDDKLFATIAASVAFPSTDFFIAYQPGTDPRTVAKSAAVACLANDVAKWEQCGPYVCTVGPIQDIGEDPARPGVYLLRCTVVQNLHLRRP